MLRAAILILPLLVASCSGSDTTLAADGRPPKTQAQAAKPPVQDDVAQPDGTRVSGAVIETMNAGPYTYVRMNTAQGEIWAAVNEAALKPGEQITIGDAMWMENFESKTLNRKFDHILFGSLVGAEAAAALPPGHPPTAAASSGASSGMAGLPAAPPAVVKVDKASGPDARTVAELWAQKAALNGKEVVVRGQVVKWNPDIMGRHWLHLRDGSGSAEKQDNDITVTTNDVVAKGDVVTMRGKVAIDKDFTAGYAYPVMIEEAKVVK